MNNNILYRLIEDRINDEDLSMFLLDAPTGAGKTYHILNFIRANYKKYKIFFIANQLKLLPSNENILDGLVDEEKNDLQNEILRLPSILDSFLEAKEKDVFSKLPIPFKNDNIEVINLIFSILKQIEDNKNNNICELLTQEFTRLEHQFRDAVKMYVKSKGLKRNALKKEDWITIFYPAVLLEDKHVILCSTKKFFLPIDPIYDKATLLPNQKYDNAILFIDEFDATKQEILDSIIQQNNRSYSVEFFCLYRMLNRALHENNMKNHIISPDEDDTVNASEILKDIIEKFDNTNEYFDKILLNHFKTSDGFPNQKNFLFNDNASLTISGDSKTKFFSYKYNRNDGINYIYTSNDFSDKNLEKVFERVLECINYFIMKMVILSQNYSKKVRESAKDNDVVFDTDHACSTLKIF